MTPENEDALEALRQEARKWYVKLRKDHGPEAKAEFEVWRRDPENAAAWDSMSRSDLAAGLYKLSDDHTPGAKRHLNRDRRIEAVAPLALAASVLLVAVVLVIEGNPLKVGATNFTMLNTNIGEIRQVVLSDGSKVTLDSSTHVEVDVGRSRRTARLKFGRARFDVAASAVPFTIESGDELVTTNNGTVDVEHQAAVSEVNVLAGTSQVQSSSRQVTLAPHLSATSNSSSPLRISAVPNMPDWTLGMLQFDATPVAAAVQLANHYSDQRILIDGDIAALPVTGAYHEGDTAGLAKAIAKAFDLSVQQTSDGNWRLKRKQGAAGYN